MSRENPYGDILVEIETGLWEHHNRVDEGIAEPYSYTDEQFKACFKIFMDAMMWKMWVHMEKESLEDKCHSASKLGEELREIILEFTGIDTYKLYDT